MSSAIRLIPLDNTTRHHDHDYHQIVIGLTGHAEFEIEGLGGSIAPLSGCIVPASHVHYYEGIGDNRQLILDLPGDAAPLTGHYHELARLFDAPRFFALDEPLRRYLAFVTLELEQARAPVPRLQDDLLTATLLGCLHSRLLPEERPQPGRPLDLAALDRFIDRHLASHLTVADLAQEACLSEAHFSERFRHQTGLPPYQYLLRKRLEAAHRLLVSSRLPLSEVAALSGFANQSALSHAFRRRYGHPPSQLRRIAPQRLNTTRLKS
ncbi:AraC family transcriptional regulator [Halomonas salifodinae]|uniref:AraC family transcriptional regulator n=1 Tax=Halomonas salifodinae TaxID=438745 RepID=UPI0033A824A8